MTEVDTSEPLYNGLTKGQILNNLDGAFIKRDEVILYESPEANIITSKPDSVFMWFMRQNKDDDENGLFRVVRMTSKSRVKSVLAAGASKSIVEMAAATGAPTITPSDSISIDDMFSITSELVVATWDKYTETFNVVGVDTDDTSICNYSYNGDRKFMGIMSEPGNHNLVEKNAFVAYQEYSILSNEQRVNVIGELSFNYLYAKAWQNSHPESIVPDYPKDIEEGAYYEATNANFIAPKPKLNEKQRGDILDKISNTAYTSASNIIFENPNGGTVSVDASSWFKMINRSKDNKAAICRCVYTVQSKVNKDFIEVNITPPDKMRTGLLVLLYDNSIRGFKTISINSWNHIIRNSVFDGSDQYFISGLRQGDSINKTGSAGNHLMTRVRKKTLEWVKTNNFDALYERVWRREHNQQLYNGLTKEQILYNLGGAFIKENRNNIYENAKSKIVSGLAYQWFMLQHKSDDNENGLYRVVTIRPKDLIKTILDTGATIPTGRFNDNFTITSELAVATWDKYTETFNVVGVDTDDTSICNFNYDGSNSFKAVFYEPGNNDLVESNAMAGYFECSILSNEERVNVIGELSFNYLYAMAWNQSHSSLVSLPPKDIQKDDYYGPTNLNYKKPKSKLSKKQRGDILDKISNSASTSKSNIIFENPNYGLVGTSGSSWIKMINQSKDNKAGIYRVIYIVPSGEKNKEFIEKNVIPPHEMRTGLLVLLYDNSIGKFKSRTVNNWNYAIYDGIFDGSGQSIVSGMRQGNNPDKLGIVSTSISKQVSKDLLEWTRNNDFDALYEKVWRIEHNEPPLYNGLTKEQILNNLDGAFMKERQKQLMFETPDSKIITGLSYKMIKLEYKSDDCEYGLYRVVTILPNDFIKTLLATGGTIPTNQFNDNFTITPELAIATWDKYTETFNVVGVDAPDTSICNFNYDGSNSFKAVLYEPGNNDIVERNALVAYFEYDILSNKQRIDIIGEMSFDYLYAMAWNKSHSTISVPLPPKDIQKGDNYVATNENFIAPKPKLNEEQRGKILDKISNAAFTSTSKVIFENHNYGTVGVDGSSWVKMINQSTDNKAAIYRVIYTIPSGEKNKEYIEKNVIPPHEMRTGLLVLLYDDSLGAFQCVTVNNWNKVVYNSLYKGLDEDYISYLREGNSPSKTGAAGIALQTRVRKKTLEWVKTNNFDALYERVWRIEHNEPPIEPPRIIPCFAKGTLISTDDGEIVIEDLTKKHTISGKIIRDIIGSLNSSSPMVTIRKNAFGLLPSRDVRLTGDHLVLYQDRWVRALDLQNLDGVEIVAANNDMVYNILLKSHGHVLVGGMIMETMNPASLKLVNYNLVGENNVDNKIDCQ